MTPAPATQPSPSPCRSAALDYLARGWSVLPLMPADSKDPRAGKRPLCKWDAYQDRLPSEQEVKLWFSRWPKANVGVAMGPVSRLIGLDVDGSAGEDTLTQLSRGDLPPTLEFSTGQGRRLLYTLPEDHPCRTIPFRAEEKEPLKVLAHDSQTVMPPSRHPSGRIYEWLAGHRPGEIEAAVCPDWLLYLLNPDAEPTTSKGGAGLHGRPDREAIAQHDATIDVIHRARKYLDSCERCHREEEHAEDASTHLLRVATALTVGFALEVETATELLHNWDRTVNPRPFPAAECERKCCEAVRTATKPRGYLLMKESKNGHTNRVHGYQAEDVPAQFRAKPNQSQPTSANSKPISPTPINADALLAQNFPEIRWAIPGLIPEGAVILAGRPKTGKSWLTLGLALAVAQGGVALGKTPVEPGHVLYLALEDGPRRLQRRLKAVLDAQPGHAELDRLELVCTWPRNSEGGIDALAAWIESHPEARLIIIDTLARVRAKRVRDTSLYEEDYEAIACMQAMAMQRNIAVVIVHHTRKSPAEDPIDDVSGTLGLTGAADAVLVLKRHRQAKTGTLFVTGRDVEEAEVNLLWDPRYCLWSMTDSTPDSTLGTNQQLAIKLLETAGHPLTALDLSARLPGVGYENIRKMLYRLWQDGLIAKAARGQYQSVSQVSQCPNDA